MKKTSPKIDLKVPDKDGDLTTGAQNDLEHATALARQMTCLYRDGTVSGVGSITAN